MASMVTPASGAALTLATGGCSRDPDVTATRGLVMPGESCGSTSLSMPAAEGGADIGRRRLETFVTMGHAGLPAGNLAAITATRLADLAEAGTPASDVRLLRGSLGRDEVTQIPHAADGARVMSACGSTGDRPLLIRDRRADPSEWSGRLVVLTP